MQKKVAQTRVVKRLRDDQERGAREAIIEELFNDFNRSRFTIYKLNFFRGIFFGLGSVLGGTIVIALIIWILSTIGHLFPPINHYVNDTVHTIQQGHK